MNRAFFDVFKRLVLTLIHLMLLGFFRKDKDTAKAEKHPAGLGCGESNNPPVAAT